jgi:hypothetical protein
MSNYLLVIAIIAAQMGVFTLAWLLVGHLRLAPYLAGTAIVCNAALGAAMAMIGARAWLPDWAGLVVANMLVVTALLAMRRGIMRFAATPTSKFEDLFIVALTTLALWVSMQDGQGSLRVVASQAPVTFLLLHTAWIARHRLTEEFGTRTARWCAAPFVLIGVFQLVRFVGSLGWPTVLVPRLDQPAAANVAFTLAVMIAGLCINLAMLTMVILRVVRRLDHLTRQDPMTGLLNRRAIEDALRHEVGLARPMRASHCWRSTSTTSSASTTTMATRSVTPRWWPWRARCANRRAPATWSRAWEARSSGCCCRTPTPMARWRWPNVSAPISSARRSRPARPGCR